MLQTINKDITLNGAIAVDGGDTIAVNIPANVRVCAIRFTEIANASSKNYDISVADKTGIQMDYTHRLDLLSVINGSTFRNAAFKELVHPITMDGNQAIKLKYKMIDALAGGQSIVLRVTVFCENI